MSKLPSRLAHRARREIAVLLPVRGRLPRSWVARMAPVIGARTWRDYFSLDRGPGWLWTRRDQEETRAWVHNRMPRLAGGVTERAQDFCRGRIPILGHGLVDWTPATGWRTDPIARVEWPMVRAERIPIVLPDNRSDIKHIWEPARFHFAPTLGVAYYLSGDVRYAETFRDYVTDFIRENPCGYGPHWTNPMEMAIRACNWIVGWQWCRTAPVFDESFVRSFIGSLIAHGRVIARNLERTRRGLNTNHYLADLVGLYAIATFVPEWKESPRWRKLAWNELLAESEHQILPDGFCYESSFGYHRLTFEIWHFAWALARRHGEPGCEVLLSRLAKMASFSDANADQCGHLPQFGDGDDGRFVYWEPRDPSDHSFVIQMGQAISETGQPTSGITILGDPIEDALWFCGADAFESLWSDTGHAMQLDRPPRQQSRMFPATQVGVFRSNRWLIHAFANPVGSGGIGGHKHNDLLSFTASIDGEPVIIDPGTGAYTADPSARNRLRRTSAHATVAIDSEEQNRFVMGQLFCLWRDANPEIVEFTDTGNQVKIVMRHDGYARLTLPVIHTRTITLDRTDDSILIKDRLDGSGQHDVEVAFPFADVAFDSITDTSATLALAGGPRLELALESDSPMTLELQLDWRSRAYGVREGHRRLVFRGAVSAPCEWETRIRIEPEHPDADMSTEHSASSRDHRVETPIGDFEEVVHA